MRGFLHFLFKLITQRHEFNPSVVVIADRMLITVWMISFQVSLFFIRSLVKGFVFSLFYFGYWPLAICRLEDGELNSRGFSNPWKTSRFNYRAVCKDGDFNTVGLLSPRPRCRSASLQTPFLFFLLFSRT